MTNDSILNKIRALLNKTTDNGCTEAEAMMAASKAAEMMDRHGFDNESLEIKEDITEDCYFAPGKHLGPVNGVAVQIAKFCDVKIWSIRGRVGTANKSKIVFFGRESDVLVCKYLIHLVSTAFNTEYEKYFAVIKGTSAHTMHGKTIRASFESGMSNRLNHRLHEMKETRNQTVDTNSGKSGMSLVITKNKDVDNAFNALNIRITAGASKITRISNNSAYGAGQSAANNVNINSGVGRSNVAGYIS